VREPLDPSPEERAEDEYWVGLYGRFEPLGVPGVVDFFAGFDRPWWLVGGWALEAFTGAPREHEDVDVSMLSCDVPAFREFVGHRWHLWTITNGALRPLDDHWPDLPAPDCQIWVRRDAISPWVMDVPLTPDVGGRWQNKRLPEHVAQLTDVTWVTDDGVRVINPEIALLFKARINRTKDRRDLARTLPLLSARQRAWLHEHVRELWPEHDWLEQLGTDGPAPASDTA
jgi:hypothetical protein